MKKYKWIIIITNLILVFLFFNYALFKKEKLLADGQLVLLELAPVDPRSLIQGDYMRLRYAIARHQTADSIAKRGFCVVQVTEEGIAEKVRFQEHKTPIQANELLIQYTKRNSWQIHIGAESFFFQEGTADKYEQAKYGGLKIDQDGNSILVGLYDKHRKRIE